MHARIYACELHELLVKSSSKPLNANINVCEFIECS